jgi:hypothetical protein
MWYIPHADAAGTLYDASDDYRWFRLIVGFERAACTPIDDGYFRCGNAKIIIGGDGDFQTISGHYSIWSTGDSSLQSVSTTGTNKRSLTNGDIAASALYRGVRQSDALYHYTSVFADVRTCWRIGRARSKLTITGQAAIWNNIAEWPACEGCVDVFTAWQTDWISADLATVTPISDGDTLLSRGTTWSDLFSFDMDPDGAAIP